jgi:DNA-binding NarL/FixJ family response regulator
MIQSGKRSKEIASSLFISINTVNRHRQNILEKMRVGNMTEACTLATKLKWL